MASSQLTASPDSSKTVSFELNPNGLEGEGAAIQVTEPMDAFHEDPIGRLNVHIHQARDIHNICIYHKQDVYAKFCLTSKPDNALSTKTINGGGRSPVFNENLELSVLNIESSLKCEIWMLSRVRNYLEDQLLGFALVPLADVVAADGKLAQEFSLSSNDLFHSPAGFVSLSLSYVGSSPEVMAIPVSSSPTISPVPPNPENADSVPCEVVEVQFPDMQVVNENQLMVSEIFGIPCYELDSQCSENLISAENGDTAYSNGVRIVESFSSTNEDADTNLKKASPTSSVSVNESVPQSFSVSSGVADPTIQKEKNAKNEEGEVSKSDGIASNAFTPSLININVPEQTIVQQDIVNIYMKSMQQFTDSLAKMRLPMDVGSNSNQSETSTASPEQKEDTPKSSGPRVFYGSRAFF